MGRDSQCSVGEMSCKDMAHISKKKNYNDINLTLHICSPEENNFNLIVKDCLALTNFFFSPSLAPWLSISSVL